MSGAASPLEEVVMRLNLSKRLTSEECRTLVNASDRIRELEDAILGADFHHVEGRCPWCSAWWDADLFIPEMIKHKPDCIYRRLHEERKDKQARG